MFSGPMSRSPSPSDESDTHAEDIPIILCVRPKLLTCSATVLQVKAALLLLQNQFAIHFHNSNLPDEEKVFQRHVVDNV